MYVKITFIMLNVHNYVCGSRGGTTGAVQLKQLASDYWEGHGQIIKANCLSCAAPVVPPLVRKGVVSSL